MDQAFELGVGAGMGSTGVRDGATPGRDAAEGLGATREFAHEPGFPGRQRPRTQNSGIAPVLGAARQGQGQGQGQSRARRRGGGGDGRAPD